MTSEHPAVVMVFEVGTRRLALPSDDVHELVRAVAVTALPGAPASVDGVIDLRGEIIPVFDLATRVGVVPRAMRAADQLIISSAGPTGKVAVRADRVHELRRITNELAPRTLTADPFIGGLLQLPDGVVVICDLAAFLTAEDVAGLATAMGALP